jgi:hypothetical protein
MAHIALVAVILIAIRFAPTPSALDFVPDTPSKDIVWLDVPVPAAVAVAAATSSRSRPNRPSSKAKKKLPSP